MATYMLDQTDLRSALTPKIDPSVQDKIIDYLVGRTAYTNPDDGSQIWVQTNVFGLEHNPSAQAVITTAPENPVTTPDGDQLKAVIINSSLDGVVSIDATRGILVATGNGAQQV